MMKFKVLFLIVITGLLNINLHAQRGVRIGYIDTEYILQNVPEYQEASAQLDKKALDWKTEIEKRLSVVEQKKTELDNEKVLLTQELYDERYEDITFEESEIIDYQQKRFGPNGDLMTQKRQLIEPIQDQIFAAVQEIAETKKFDFVFDKSADVVMLYSAERYDISEQVLRTITRSSRRKQAKSREERKALEDEEVVPIVNADKDERQKALDERKAQREAELATKRAEREAALEERRKKQEELRETKRKEAEARRQAQIDARNKRRAGTSEAETDSKTSSEDESVETNTSSVEKSTSNTMPPSTETKKTSGDKNPEEDTKKESGKSTDRKRTEKDSSKVKADSSSVKKNKTAAEIQEELRQKKIKDREARQKALEERKKKIIEQRKKAREAREKEIKRRDSIAKAKKNKKENN